VASAKVVYGSESFSVTIPTTAHEALTSGKWDPIAELLEAKDAIHARMTALGFANA
jgi:3-isopropylmalate/(R)-2-methylmalate dehydratase small subunit